MTQAKEELYLRRVFNDDVPVFVDVTRYARRELPYPLSAKKALKATCGVRTDNEVVAFSLRHYTVRQAEREVEHVEDEGQNLLRPRMPRKTLHDLIETARALSSVLGEELIAELDGRLYVLRLTRAADGSTLELVGALTEGEDGYVRSEITGDRFELPVSGVRLRMFLRSPVRDRVLAYAFGGYLARRPGETETVGRAVASALNSLLGLATFRMLSGMNRVETADRSHEPVAFAVPVLLFTADGTPAARGDVAGKIDLDHVDPVTGGLRIHLTDRLEWNPAVAGGFGTYERILTETIGTLIQSALGADVVRDIAYDIMLGTVGPEASARLSPATAALPALAATPDVAEARPVRH